MKKYKDNELAEVLRQFNPDDSVVLGEIGKVVYEVHTKDGKVHKRTITGNQMAKTLSMYQTTSNCLGFPFSRDADFAALKSAMARPTKLLSDYMEGKLDKFFDGQYNSPKWKDGKLTLDTWSEKHVYNVGARKKRLEFDLVLCAKLHDFRRKKK